MPSSPKPQTSSPHRDLNGQSPSQQHQLQHVSNAAMTQPRHLSSSSYARGAVGPGTRRESRPITSIATTTAVPSSNAPTAGSRQGGQVISPAPTRTEDTTFSLPIDIIDRPDLDELGLSPVGSASPSRPSSPLSSTPVIPHPPTP